MIRTVLFFLSLFGIYTDTEAVFTTTHANNIHTAVTSGYNILVRPSAVTTVQLEFSLLAINDLDLKAQTMSTSGWLSVIWTDSRLTWTPGSYGDIEYIYLSDTKLWKPELIIDNAVEEISVLAPDDLLFRVKYNGEVKWDPPGVFVSHCEMDTTWYPFDKQKCKLEVTSWAYTKEFLTLSHYVSNLNMADFEINGEWTIVSTSLGTSELTENGESFSQLEFIIEVQRRSGYYVANVIFPVVLTAILTTVTFLLPADSGEKISYILTILLALAVLLTLIADNMPSTSVNTSILGVYLSVTLAYATIAIILTVLTLRLQVMPEGSEVPKWLQRLTKSVLVRCSSKQTKVTHTEHSEQGSEAKTETNLRKAKQAALKRTISVKAWDQSDDAEENGESFEDVFPYENKEVAEMLDRFLFWVFTVLETLTTVVFMVTLAIGSAVAS